MSRLRAQRGVQADRELRAFFDYGAGAAPTPEVFVGMTQYGSLESFQAAGEALGGSPEASAFFATFTPITFTVLGPLREETPVDIASIAGEAGQVLEIAVRDLSRYAAFDDAAYGRARDAFLTLLTAQDGVVAEYQWRSVNEPSLVVGMTVYRSADAFQAVATSSAIQEAPETAAFLGPYPPIAGFVTSVVH